MSKDDDLKRYSLVFVVGLLLGAVSWGSVSLVSGKFEPYDSTIGLYIGQAILMAAAFGVGFRNGVVVLLVFIVGAHLGMNAYAYVFGSPDTRAWFAMGLLISILLVIFPMLSGLLGKLVYAILKKRNV
jgi:hypothetical protein